MNDNNLDICIIIFILGKNTEFTFIMRGSSITFGN